MASVEAFSLLAGQREPRPLHRSRTLALLQQDFDLRIVLGVRPARTGAQSPLCAAPTQLLGTGVPLAHLASCRVPLGDAAAGLGLFRSAQAIDQSVNCAALAPLGGIGVLRAHPASVSLRLQRGQWGTRRVGARPPPPAFASSQVGARPPPPAFASSQDVVAQYCHYRHCLTTRERSP